MVTNLNLDKDLVKEAIKLGRFKNTQQAVNTALAEYIQLQKRRALLDLAGTIDYVAPETPSKVNRSSRPKSQKR